MTDMTQTYTGSILSGLALCLVAGVTGCGGDTVGPNSSTNGMVGSTSNGMEGDDASATGASGTTGAGGDTTGDNATGTGDTGTSGAGTSGTGTSGSNTGTTGGEPAGPCDLSGRWLGVLHMVTDALSNQQVAFRWVYYEIAGSGTAFSVSKGLLCGDDMKGKGIFKADVDMSASWDTAMMKVNYKGLAFTSKPSASGCDLTMSKWYTVRGATQPYYTEDPTRALPKEANKATDTTPGWEDWDNDGHPGLTGKITGTVSGEIYSAPRLWAQISATVPSVSKSFVAPLLWDQESNVMAYNGGPLLASPAARASDPKLHFAEFVRLAADQAVGDDAAICDAIRTLAPTLAPTGSSTQ